MLTVILTGGGSRRMGRDKATLPWAGGTMLQSLINKYAASLGSVAVSVNRSGRFDFTGATELVDRYPNMGPLNGILSAFEQSGEELMFLTATDLPFGDPALVRRLEELMGDADACVMRRGVKGMEPLFALYQRRCYDAVARCLAAGRKSFFALFEEIKVRYVEEEELENFDLEQILFNVNTPEDLKKAKE